MALNDVGEPHAHKQPPKLYVRGGLEVLPDPPTRSIQGSPKTYSDGQGEDINPHVCPQSASSLSTTSTLTSSHLQEGITNYHNPTNNHSTSSIASNQCLPPPNPTTNPLHPLNQPPPPMSQTAATSPPPTPNPRVKARVTIFPLLPTLPPPPPS